MSGKRRLQHSDSSEKQPRASADDVLTGSEPEKATIAATSNLAQAAGAKKRPSKKRKIAAIITTPAVISGVAGAVPQAAINAAQETIHAVAGQQVYSPFQKPSVSGGEYMLSAEWQGRYPSSANRAAAEQMAKSVVDIALRKAGWSGCDPGYRHRYIQWILAGNMSPADAAQVLAQRMFRTKIRPFKELIQLIRQDRPAISPLVGRTYVHQSHLYRPPYRKP